MSVSGITPIKLFEGATSSADLGNFTSDEIVFRAKDVAKVLEQLIASGTRRFAVTKKDLKITYKGRDKPRWNTVMDVVRSGNYFFDSLIYMSMAPNERPEPVEIDRDNEHWTDDPKKISQGLFVVYFFLFTRGAIPEKRIGDSSDIIPRFLSKVMNFTGDLTLLIGTLSSFNIGTMDPSWIKEINTSTFSTEAINRLGLGAAGHRSFAPFKYLQPVADASPEAKTACELVRQVAMTGPFWDFHPLFKNPATVSMFGSLNSVLDDLMAHAFSREDLERMQKLKVIFKIPIKSELHHTWHTWGPDTFKNFTDKIFVKKPEA